MVTHFIKAIRVTRVDSTECAGYNISSFSFRTNVVDIAFCAHMQLMLAAVMFGIEISAKYIYTFYSTVLVIAVKSACNPTFFYILIASCEFHFLEKAIQLIYIKRICDHLS